MYNKYQRAYTFIKAMEGCNVSWSNGTYLFFIMQTGNPPWIVLVANMAFMLTYLLLDPFTGRLGDKYGQRPIYVLGIIFWGLGMLIYGFSLTIPAFIFAEFTAGIGNALMSEALESWLENSICETAAIRARGATWRQLSGIPCVLIGGVAGAAFGFRAAWFLSAGSSLVAAILSSSVLLRFPKPAYRHAETEVPSLRESLSETRRNRNLSFAFMFVMITSFAFQPLNMYWPAVLKNASGGADWWQSFVWVPVAFALAYGARLTHQLSDVKSKHFTYILMATGVLVLIGGWGASRGILWLAIAGFVVSEIPRGAINNVLFTFSNKHIRNENRSTMNSIRSAAFPTGAFLGLGSFALFGNIFPQPEVAWIASGLILIGFTFYVRNQKFD